MHCITHSQSMNRPTFWLISRLLPLKRILIYPPITRIDAGQSQQVNFVLRKGKPLTHEVMLKASFEGIMQTTENSIVQIVLQALGLDPKSGAFLDENTVVLHIVQFSFFSLFRCGGPTAPPVIRIARPTRRRTARRSGPRR